MKTEIYMHSSFNKRLALIAAAFVVATASMNADITADVDDYPDTASRSTSTNYSGTLSAVADKVSGETDGRKIGDTIYTIATNASTDVGEAEPCCMDDDSDGSKWHITKDNSDITVDASITVEIKTPTWADYASACSSAQTEWDRFSNAVEEHEQGHFDAGKEFWTEDKIKSYYEDTDLDISSECVSEDDLDAKKEDCIQQYLDVMNDIGIQIGQDLKDSDTTHDDEEPTEIDKSKDC